MKGVLHYKKNGSVYKGKNVHKDTSGKLMSGKNHTKTSVYLYHLKELPKKVQDKIKKI
jgi:hypothetical protein